MPLQPRSSFAVVKKIRPFYTGGNVEWDPENSVLLAQSGENVCKFNQATGEESSRFAVDGDAITTFTLSPDRAFVVTAHKSGLLRQWNYSGDDLVRIWRTFHTGPIPVLNFDSTSTLVLSGGSDSSVKVWDVVRQYCTHTLKGCQGVVSVAIFHTPPGQPLHIFAAATDNTIIGWNLETSEPVVSLTGHISTVTAIAPSPTDPNTLVSCGRDGVIRVWDISEQKSVRAIAAMECLEDLKFLPNGSFESKKMGEPYFMTGGAKGAIRVWSLASGKIVGRKPLSTTPSDDAVVSEASSGPAIVKLAVANVPEVGFEVHAVTFDHNILTFELPTFDLKGRLVGHNDDVLDARFVGKADQFLAVASNALMVKIYDLATTSCEFLEGHGDSVMTLGRWAKMSHVFASGSKDKSIFVWKRCSEGKDGSSKRIWVKCGTASGHTGAITSLGCSHAAGGGKFWLASASEDTTVKLWSMGKVNTSKDAPGECVHLTALFTEIAHEKGVNSVCFSPNDMLLATGGQDHTAKLWTLGEDKKSGLRLKGTFRGHRRGIWCVQFSPVDQILVTGSTDSTLRLWSIADFSCLKTFEGHGSSVLKTVFINGGTQLLSAAADGLIKLWSVKTALCTLTLDEHEDRIWALDLNKKGTEFVTGSADAAIIVWKDDTEEQAEKKAAEVNERVEQEQLLSNLLLDGKYYKALGLTLSLEQPMKALIVIRAMMNSGCGDFAELEKTLKRLRDDQVAVLIRFLSRWNTNAKNYFPAQVTLNSLLKHRTVDELVKIPTVAKTLPGIISYSKKHKARLERLRQAASFVRFIHETVKATAGAGISLPQSAASSWGMEDFEQVEVKEEPEEPGSDEESGVVTNGDESVPVSEAGDRIDDNSEEDESSDDEEDIEVEEESSSEGDESDTEGHAFMAPPPDKTPRIQHKLDVEDIDGNLDFVSSDGRVMLDDDEEMEEEERPRRRPSQYPQPRGGKGKATGFGKRRGFAK